MKLRPEHGIFFPCLMIYDERIRTVLWDLGSILCCKILMRKEKSSEDKHEDDKRVKVTTGPLTEKRNGWVVLNSNYGS